MQCNWEVERSRAEWARVSLSLSLWFASSLWWAAWNRTFYMDDKLARCFCMNSQTAVAIANPSDRDFGSRARCSSRFVLVVIWRNDIYLPSNWMRAPERAKRRLPPLVDNSSRRVSARWAQDEGALVKWNFAAALILPVPKAQIPSLSVCGNWKIEAKAHYIRDYIEEWDKERQQNDIQWYTNRSLVIYKPLLTS